MRTYQQVVIYIIPLLGNLSIINLVVVLVRLYWFETRFKDIVRLSHHCSFDRRHSVESSDERGRDTTTLREKLATGKIRDIRVPRPRSGISSRSKTSPSETEGMRLRATVANVNNPNSNTIIDLNSNRNDNRNIIQNKNDDDGIALTGNMNEKEENVTKEMGGSITSTTIPVSASAPPSNTQPVMIDQNNSSLDNNKTERSVPPTHISFSVETNLERRERALRIPGPREFESGQTVREVDDDDLIKIVSTEEPPSSGPSGDHNRRRLPTMERILSRAVSVEHAASNAFILGKASHKRSRSRSSNTGSRSSSKARQSHNMPYLSYQPTIGRNSRFLDLTDEQRDELGGIEYRSLRLLAKIVFGYYVFWHVLGAICLIGWIHNSDHKYRDYLRSVGQSPTWWAIYSGMTTFNNLGYTLTPDSMISFRTATFPILLMTLLIYIGNTAYPCMLRLIIWLLFKLSPRNSRIREPLNFLLDHPRRCFTLLFPSSPTWMLFFSLVFLNFIDVLLFLVLDLHNEEVLGVPSMWNRFLAALFQAASARTTGTNTFSISKVHPAVQFMLMVMMYISAYPIAISVRRTNIYEETSLGLYDSTSEEIDESNTTASYLGTHLKKQLAFDLWYVFLGMFILMVTEGPKLADKADPEFVIFSVFFEAVSAYGNVGLSLGHTAINSGLTTRFTVLGKLVICALMIRGRHRGLPYELDRAIILPSERNPTESSSPRQVAVSTALKSADTTIAVSSRSRTT
ncbi:potassium transport protein [Paracoccidioides lutzii Pb01]|uniref:Potassium transport protein n=1 Tax=Paracoccidioides lutzii (strain ATCC MYA-826 / Pb01) TaxID=502779 RepID=C1H2U6_PARBA|nr:potassium transport protein [Paracoccidioides lutzii Pb01]EEH34040.2 potassium transport protein [Paracoccidioides lutzii Pb01]